MRKLAILIILLILSIASPSYALIHAYKGLTGGASANLDGIPVASISDGEIAVISDQKHVRAWDVKSGQEFFSIEGELEAFSPNRRTIVTYSEADKVRLWDVATGQEIYSVAGDRAELGPDERTYITLTMEVASL